MSNIRININCIYSDQGAWCTNKNIKRSLCGIGARCCVEYPHISKQTCEFKEKHKRPVPPPPPPKPMYSMYEVH